MNSALTLAAGKHIRHATTAINMILTGAVHYIESETGPEDTQEQIAESVRALWVEVLRELADWDLEGLDKIGALYDELKLHQAALVDSD